MDEDDDEEHLEAPHRPILAVNVSNNNAHIFQIENVIEGHTRSWPRSSFAPLTATVQNNEKYSIVVIK